MLSLSRCSGWSATQSQQHLDSIDSCRALAGYAQLQSQTPILGFLKDVNQRSSELLTSQRLDQSIAKGGCNSAIRLEECWPLETQLVQIFAFKL